MSDNVVQLPVRRHWFTQQVAYIMQQVYHMRSDYTPFRLEVYFVIVII